MPTYEYSCGHCRRDMEIFHSITAPPVTICPECEKPGLKRNISGGAGLIFKGSGFYETDYKRQSSTKESAAESKPAQAAASSKAADGAATAK